MSEQAAFQFASRGVRAMAIRLPQVHGGEGKAGFVGYLYEAAREKAHRRLYRRRQQSLAGGASGSMSRASTGSRWKKAEQVLLITPYPMKV